MFIFDIGNFLQFAITIIILLVIGVVYLILHIRDVLSDKRWKKKNIKNEKIAIEIIDVFEKLLEKNNIQIPSKDRENYGDEACIFGTEYYDLENSIIKILNNK